MMKNTERTGFTKNVALVGMMTALLTTGKAVLSFIPNVEIVSFMIIMFSVYFGRKTLLAVFAFVLIEGFAWLNQVYFKKKNL